MTVQDEQALTPQKTVRDLLAKVRPQIKAALPNYIDVDYMNRVAMTTLQRQPALLECDPVTFVGAIIQSAQLGLIPDPILGEAYLLPFENNKKHRKEVQLIPGYRGLMKIVKNSGQITTIYAQEVYKEDKFRYQYGTNSFLDHVRSEEESRGKITHFYAIAKFLNGDFQFEVMSYGDVEKIRKRSKAAYNGPWVTDFSEMGKKTVIRRLCKYLVKSPNIQTAIHLDERAEAGKPQDLGILASELEMGTETEPSFEAPQPRKPVDNGTQDTEKSSGDGPAVADPGSSGTDLPPTPEIESQGVFEGSGGGTLISEAKRVELFQGCIKAGINVGEMKRWLSDQGLKNLAELRNDQVPDFESWVVENARRKPK